jgi:hypothetical protein
MCIDDICEQVWVSNSREYMNTKHNEFSHEQIIFSIIVLALNNFVLIFLFRKYESKMMIIK